MNKRVILRAFVFLFLAVGNVVHSQTDIFQKFNEKLSGMEYEKIFLHLDRNSYTINEDIWFKIYLLDGKHHFPLPGINTVYVDLVTPEGEILIHKPFLIENGTGKGNFLIGDSLRTGVYKIYAYTGYLKNFGLPSFFKKDITISHFQLGGETKINTDSIISDKIHSHSLPLINLQFMPEGGYLVHSIQNNLAFKITGIDGKGINLNGVIRDNDHQFVDSLRSTHLGMGRLTINPRPGVSYYAVMDGFPADTFSLPSSTDKPLIQYIGITDSIVHFRLTDLNAADDGKQYYLAVKAKGELLFYFEKKINRVVSNFNLHLSNFHKGINQVILFDSEFRPLAERLFYINSEYVTMNIHLPRDTFRTREKTEIHLEIPFTEDQFTGGSFSLSVINLDQIGATDVSPENIVSFLELESEIRGYIENPGYYFTNSYEMIKDELDLLLLTQGWTKYIWDEMFISSLPDLVYTREEGLTVEGRAQRLIINRGLKEGNIILLVPSEYIILEATTDSMGYFRFDNLILHDSTKIVVQSRNRKNRKSTRLIDAYGLITQPPRFPVDEFYGIDPQSLKTYYEKAYRRFVTNSYFDFDKDHILIEEVTIVGKKKEKDDGHFRLYSEANNVIDMDEYPNTSYSDIFMFLQGLVPGLYIEGDYISIRRASGPPLILLDGMEIDLLTARNIPLVVVDKIEVLKDASNTAVFGVKGGNGVIAIYTKRGENVIFETPLFDILTKSIEGYGGTKQFYAPDYDDPKTNPAIIDQRATLYWTPELVPDTEGICKVSFFNSDDSGRVAVIGEGIMNNGKPVVGRAFYQVKGLKTE